MGISEKGVVSPQCVNLGAVLTTSEVILQVDRGVVQRNEVVHHRDLVRIGMKDRQDWLQ